MSRRRLVVATVLALALTVGAVAPAVAAGAQDGSNTSTGNATAPANETGAESTPSEDGEYSLSELRKGGQKIPGADPSMRWLESGSVFVDYESAEPLAPEPAEWEVQNVLGPGSLVQTDTLTFNAQRPRDAESAEYELVVVSYDAKHVQEGNTTVERATDIQKDTYTLSFDGAFARQEVDLPNTDGEREQVTMWLVDANGDRVDGARWRFEHRSAPTSVDAGISSYGDLLQWAAIFIILPGLVGIPLAQVSASKILKKTGKGPMLPGFIYASAIFIGGFFTLLLAWYQLTTALTNLPLLLGGMLVVVAFVGFLERGSYDTVRALFVREELQDATSPTGDSVQDALYQDVRDQRLVRTDEDGEYTLVDPGIRPFLARWFGVAPTIDVSELETQIKLKGDKWDRMFVADPDSPEALEYERATLGFSLVNDVEDDAGILAKIGAVKWGIFAWAGTLGVIGYVLASGLVGLGPIGATLGALLGAAIKGVEVQNGDVEFIGAPVHATTARQTLAASQSEYSDAKTLEEMENIAWSERSKSALEARRVMSQMDGTVTQAMLSEELGLGDVDDESPEPTEDVDDESPESSESRTNDQVTDLVRAEGSADD